MSPSTTEDPSDPSDPYEVAGSLDSSSSSDDPSSSSPPPPVRSRHEPPFFYVTTEGPQSALRSPQSPVRSPQLQKKLNPRRQERSESLHAIAPGALPPSVYVARSQRHPVISSRHRPPAPRRAVAPDCMMRWRGGGESSRGGCAGEREHTAAPSRL
jgi:hypothetical protein